MDKFKRNTVNDKKNMEASGLTRREFLKGAAAGTAALAATGVLGISCATTGGSGSGREAESNWDTPPEPIPASKVTETAETDVLVIGAGNAGLFAAAAAAEAGVRVMVLERLERRPAAREWIGAVGSSMQKAAGIRINKWEIVEELCKYASHRCRQDLISLWADKSGETVDWLAAVVKEQDPGVYIHLETDMGNEDHGFYKTFPIQHNVQNDQKALHSLEFVEKKALQMGTVIRYNTSLLQLIREDGGTGRVSGAYARKDDGILRVNAAKGVIICTGGYVSSESMMRQLNPMAVKYCTALESSYNLGDGIKAAVWAGAAMDDQPTVMVFDRGGIPAGTPAGGVYSKPGIITHVGSQPFLKVNLGGERFVNESLPYDFIYAAGTEQPGGLYCQIWDANWREQTRQFHTIGCSRIQYSPTGGKLMLFDEDASEQFWQRVLMPAGIVVKANSLEELAEKLYLPAETLKKTVSRYNDLCAKGADEDFGKESYRMLPLGVPPYYGTTLGGQLLCTLDGLRINTDMQVLDKDYEVIRGLYAAGNDSGGFFANNYPELVIGCACGRTITFGRIAGQNAAGRV